VNWEDDGGLSAFRIDPVSAQLIFLNRVTTRGSRPNQVVLGPTGQVAATVNYATGNVVLYRVLPDGRLSEPTYQDQHVGPARSAHGGPRAHGIAFSQDGRWMYVAELGLDRVYAYHIDPDRAVARADETTFVALHGGSGPRRLQLSANGRFLYVNHETDGEVSVLSVRGGQLAEIQRLSTLPVDYKGQNLTAEIVLGRDGRTLYVSNRGSDTIAAYRVDSRTGKLQLLGFTPSGGMVPRNLRIDPSGRFLLSANEKSGTITAIPIETDGRLGTARVEATLETPGGMFFVPDQGFPR
jgi:6-phosphogluconolactonase